MKIFDYDKPLLRFIATGNTYPYRDIFCSWAWFWDKDKRLWANENEVSEEDPCIQTIKDLSGVEVKCEGPIK